MYVIRDNKKLEDSYALHIEYCLLLPGSGGYLSNSTWVLRVWRPSLE